ncbi:unnamed protein product [Cladocopium goreaui]|uniref:Leucine rich repeats and calponin homology domain containing 1 n=1 Tax=Cladocopium goreaui TaxID=2562237 RepID=A0A9P1DG53_9DINO|nr:unnamed protein product [Cladocopium goreaui]CAI4009157.1 unnamed protein product [Cladocopium goreaui]
MMNYERSRTTYHNACVLDLILIGPPPRSTLAHGRRTELPATCPICGVFQIQAWDLNRPTIDTAEDAKDCGAQTVLTTRRISEFGRQDLENGAIVQNDMERHGMTRIPCFPCH